MCNLFISIPPANRNHPRDGDATRKYQLAFVWGISCDPTSRQFPKILKHVLKYADINKFQVNECPSIVHLIGIFAGPREVGVEQSFCFIASRALVAMSCDGEDEGEAGA